MILEIGSSRLFSGGKEFRDVMNEHLMLGADLSHESRLNTKFSSNKLYDHNQILIKILSFRNILWIYFHEIVKIIHIVINVFVG